jgi:hypothetical protein
MRSLRWCQQPAPKAHGLAANKGLQRPDVSVQCRRGWLEVHTKLSVLMRNVAIAMVFAAVAACSSTTLSTEPIILSQSEAADSVKVRVGQMLVVDGIRVRFMGVESDSRCPSDAVCIWQGDAVANFSVELDCECRAAAISLPLHINMEPRSGTAYGHRVELKGLQPYPRSESQIKPDAYWAWVRVVRE